MNTIMFPGQGAQYKGMGKELFRHYRNETDIASQILGYDLEELCIHDPKRQLGKTQFTQPALYTVNAFSYYHQKSGQKPDFLIGHSLGEYNALLAGEAFDFETGLRLVQKRGSLMAEASGGGMAAVIGVNEAMLKQMLEEQGYSMIDIANYNSPEQLVLSGQKDAIREVVKDFSKQGIKIIPLFVSAPFHSRYMAAAAREFAGFINTFQFNPLKTPVIANVTARPYQESNIQGVLCDQIEKSVQWIDSIRYLMGQGVEVYDEIGGLRLTKMVKSIQANCSPIIEPKSVSKPVIKPSNGVDMPSSNGKLNPTSLGSQKFREDYGIKYAYISGAMYRGIASKELVIRMAKANLLGFLGTGGMKLEEIKTNIEYIQRKLNNGEAYGMNLLHNLNNPEFEMDTAKLYLEYGIKNVEAAAYMKITKSLVYYRLSGLSRKANGVIECNNRIIAKVSRPEVAEVFMLPAPERLVNKLLDEELITAEQAALGKLIPMSYDICVEADSGGHTDRGVAMVLLPSIQRLRADIESQSDYPQKIRVGLAGGIGTPQSAACAFVMKADFILTGSINQCTVEAGISDLVKDLLQEINVQDTSYAPAGDMFEIGAKVQVLKKGVLFPARANKLYELYSFYNSLDEIPEKTIRRLEKNYFKKSLSEVWEETRTHFLKIGERKLIEKAEQNPKSKMALVFRWYFGYSSRLAFSGELSNKANFQIHTGSSLGAFNQWVKGTELEDWRARHVDSIGIKIMEETADLLSSINNIHS